MFPIHQNKLPLLSDLVNKYEPVKEGSLAQFKIDAQFPQRTAVADFSLHLKPLGSTGESSISTTQLRLAPSDHLENPPSTSYLSHITSESSASRASVVTQNHNLSVTVSTDNLKCKLDQDGSPCGRIFTRSRDLRRHVTTVHLNELVPCPKGCGKRMHYDNVDKHLRSGKHSNKRMPCILCQRESVHRSYTRKDNLVRHLKNDHKVAEDQIKSVLQLTE